MVAAANDPGGPVVLGVCGGYQMLGRTIADPDGVEAGGPSSVDGLGLLDVETTFRPEKVTRQRRGTALGQPVDRLPDPPRDGATASEPTTPGSTLDDDWGTHDDGASARDGRVLGTTVHGLFEGDDVRAAILAHVAARRGRPGRRPGCRSPPPVTPRSTGWPTRWRRTSTSTACSP